VNDRGWIGVDLDGTLAHYDGWRGVEHVGEPIGPMLFRVRKWLDDGRDVRIMTARVSGSDRAEADTAIRDWCRKHIGRELPVTCAKDYAMVELWDDRAVQVVPNVGTRVDGKP